MENYIIELEENGIDRIQPNFIYNRFDLFFENEHQCRFRMAWNSDEMIIPVLFEKKRIRVGLWLTNISEEQLLIFTHYLFEKYKKVVAIQYENGVCKVGKCIQKNHFQIALPDDVTELEKRLSSKGRYNIKRETRMLSEIGELRFEEYSASEVPSEIIEQYFEMKNATHHTVYGLSSQQYLQKYHVTDVYVMYLDAKMISIVLSCEQCEVVYIENLSYDIQYAKYSPGQVMYDYYLKRLVEKGYKSIFLGGGSFEYKKRYGSEEKIVFDGIVYRNFIVKIGHMGISMYHSMLGFASRVKKKMLREKFEK